MFIHSVCLFCIHTRTNKLAAGANQSENDDLNGNEGQEANSLKPKRDARKQAGEDWEESEAEVNGEGDEEVGGGAKYVKPRSQRKVWQLDDDIHLLIVYAQVLWCACSGVFSS